MGGGSSSKSSSSSTTNKEYKDTTTTNPYVTSTTTNKGTNTQLQQGTALDTLYKFTNQNIGNLLNQYLNPTTDNAVNQAKLDIFNKNLQDQTRKNLENNIISPLTDRNMIRSSQATDLYNNLAKQQNDAIADYTAQLTANSQNDTANMINTLLNGVFQGYNVISGNQAQSLQTSAGNASSTTNTSGKTSGISYGL